MPKLPAAPVKTPIVLAGLLQEKLGLLSQAGIIGAQHDPIGVICNLATSIETPEPKPGEAAPTYNDVAFEAISLYEAVLDSLLSEVEEREAPEETKP
jgi:hypothetical protein